VTRFAASSTLAACRLAEGPQQIHKKSDLVPQMAVRFAHTRTPARPAKKPFGKNFDRLRR
jgi:hypothetical protein